jgi:hypothetical protein
LASINDAIDADDHEALIAGLALPSVGMNNVSADCAHTYLEELHKEKVNT